MPKVQPLGTPGMKAKATARRSADAAAQRMIKDLMQLKLEAGVKTEEEFAEKILGMPYGTFRKRKSEPGTLRLSELRQIDAAARQFGWKIRFGFENEGESV